MEKVEYEKMFFLETNYWWYKGLHDLVFKIIKKYAPKNAKIMDAGCGTGGMLKKMSDHFTDIQGFDVSELALELARKRGLQNIFLQDINTWKADREFDVILSLDVVCSYGVDYKKVFENFYASLARGGILILNLPAFEVLRRAHDKAVHIEKRFVKKDLDFLLSLGFKPLILTYRLPFLFFVIFFRKLVQKVLGTEKKSDLRQLPEFVNKFFTGLHLLENELIMRGLKIPFGSSLFFAGKKI